ncbi:septal ring lytic transglycosylase RlpA family protein [Temperatibacter marinus]|uniref:Endolytic peptidoglycan transglycosylase RlpA n=1 Tax=Temperatibacter marinus TaxID=1456591 RepID=A0AA52H8W9_9PROT|nr:septal ring lytic transglycosylase RlpA family protein [Temperatibacter marinus]WND02259.1 septal ring lytic transglycosylase RlpA family protein [Temperatibacter marinus]
MNRLFLLIILLFLAACSGPRPIISSKPDTAPMPNDNQVPLGPQGGHKKVGNPYRIAGEWYYPKDEPAYDEVGLASWYGPQFHGKKTANGETFNMNALTAAHKTLALPSFVKVTNLDNNRSIVLRVNDRGPYVGNRLIDLSRRAAQILGFAEKGVTKVRVQAVDQYGRVPENQQKASKLGRRGQQDLKMYVGDTAHYIQVGAYSDQNNATQDIEKAKNIGLRAFISKVYISGREIFRVRIGPFRERETADRVLRKIVNRGFFDAKVLSEVVK